MYFYFIYNCVRLKLTNKTITKTKLPENNRMIPLIVEVKTMKDSMICSKCGSLMKFRRRISFRGTSIKIKQCTVCKHYESLNNM